MEEEQKKLIEQKKSEAEKRYDEIQKEIRMADEQISKWNSRKSSLNTEAVRLQGEFRAYEKLLKPAPKTGEGTQSPEPKNGEEENK
jgi:predicted  nucleic acid-binding Zn-ribbon protein